MSKNELYDLLKEQAKVTPFKQEDLELFTSVKHLDLQYLNNIYSFIICYYIQQCIILGYSVVDIVNFLNVNIPYNGKFLNASGGRGLSFRLEDLPTELQSIIACYLKNYFL